MLCMATVFGLSWSGIPYDKMNLNVFDARPRDFELGVIESMEMTQKFYARDDILLAIGTTAVLALDLVAFKFAPFISQFWKQVPLFQNIVEDQGPWSGAFISAIANETLCSITDSEIRWMSSSMQTIRTKVKLLGANNTDLANRKTLASIMHTELDKTINFFDIKNSLFRKYPLIGVAPLLALTSLVAAFDPIARQLIPFEAQNTQISCKMYDILLDYRPRTIAARLRKLTAEMPIFKPLVDVMALPYNGNGYNATNPGVIDCERHCNASQPATIGGQICLKDEFSDIDFHMTLECVASYAKFIRYRIEKLFPIDIMDKLCVDREPKKPTGNLE